MEGRKVQFRHIVLYYFKKGKSAAETHTDLCSVVEGAVTDATRQSGLQRALEWGAPSHSRNLSGPGTESMSPALAGGFFTTEPPGMKAMLRIWWECKGVLSYGLFLENQVINSNKYCSRSDH